MSRTFNRFMVADDIGTNRKLRRLPVAERWVYVAGVLALAAQSPIRGALLISDGEPVTDQDVAMQATVPVKTARSAMDALRGLGMLERDKDGIEWVHDWELMNKDPKPSDAPEATRERKRRQRQKSRGVTRDTRGGSRGNHAPEVEGEGEVENSLNSGLTSEVVDPAILAGDPGPEPGSNVFDILDGKTVSEREAS